MKNALALLFVFVSQLLFCQVWNRLPDFPGSKRDDGVAVTVGNKAYFGTGLQEGWSATIDFFELDLATNTWTNIPNMPHTTERQYACAFAGNGCFYVFGGVGPTGALNNLYKYSIATRSWSLMSPKPGLGLMGASCIPFGDKVIIAGGKTQANGGINQEVWEYAISTDSWVQKNNFPFKGRWRASATALHNFGYFLFGIDSSGSFRKDLYRYDRNFDSWTKISDFPTPKGRAYAVMAGISDKLFVFGGYDSTNTYFNDVWYYNDILNSWTADNSLPSFGRKGGMYVSAGDKFYYSCGINKTDTRLNETWMTDVPLALKKINEESALNVYPNPATTVLFAETVNVTNCTIQLLDTKGEELYRQSVSEGTNIEIQMSQFSAGIYILKIYSAEKLMAVRKIVKT